MKHSAYIVVSYFSKPRYVQAFPMLPSALAGLPGPRPLALCVCEARPGEDVMVGQVQISRVHRKLADQLQQTGQAVQQPLSERKRNRKIKRKRQ